MNSILITGGLGFIGTSCAEFFLKKKFNVTIIDNNRRSVPSNLKNKKLKILNYDIRNEVFIKKINKKFDIVLHLAAINGTKNFYKYPFEVLEVSTKGIINIIKLCEKLKINKLLIASSSEVYSTPSNIPTTEEERILIPDIMNPRFSYSGGKIISELYGIHSMNKKIKNIIIFRPHNVYGPNMGGDHVIPEITNKILTSIKNKNYKITIQGNGLQKRSFIFIDDFLNALYLVIKKGNNEIINIGTNDLITIKKLIKSILKHFPNFKFKITFDNKNPIGGTLIRNPDIKKIKKYGFQKKISIDEGVNKTILWYKKNHK